MKELDLQLVQKAKEGDADSFSALYEQLAPSLYRTALYTLGNSHDAQEVVAETFLEAFHGIKKLRENAAFGAWMFRILSVRCKRKMRDYVRGRNESDIDEFLDLDDGSDMGQEVSLRADLLHALDTLSDSERQIVVLAVIEGYTTKETAQILRLPHGTVSSKLFRTLKKMRTMLEKE
jgi:RNA polymerase sigma-70 factor (ECF subfamily)